MTYYNNLVNNNYFQPTALLVNIAIAVCKKK